MTISDIITATPEARNAYQQRMEAAFERVKPVGNWKLAINATVAETDPAKRQDIIDAIEFYTATKATVLDFIDADGLRGFIVTAPGYYAGPAN